MKNETLLRIAVTAAALLAAVSWSIAGNQAAEAGHTIAEGHCSVGPVCVYGYDDLGDQESFRVKNVRGDISWWDGIYEFMLQETEIVWATAEGPQVPSSVQVADPAWVHLTYPNSYIECPDDADPLGKCTGPMLLQADAYVCFVNQSFALVCLIPVSQPYTLQARASRTYINTDVMGGYPYALKRHVISHELGHTMLLGHHPSSDCLVEAPEYHGPNTYVPQRCDLGFADPLPFGPSIVAPCEENGGDSDDWGIRCIFGWWREQGIAGSFNQRDCYDLNRDGLVDLPNDILPTIQLFPNENNPPAQTYQPEADTNRDGEIDLPNDILGVIQDFGPGAGYCESAHYPNA